MTKYTIEIHHVEGSGFDPITILNNISYLKVLELYALITALKFPIKEILVRSYDISKKNTSIDKFIISKSSEQLVKETINIATYE